MKPAAAHYRRRGHALCRAHRRCHCSSSLEEYRSNKTPWRDDIMRGYAKHQSRYIKRAPTHDCYKVFVEHFRPTEYGRVLALAFGPPMGRAYLHDRREDSTSGRRRRCKRCRLRGK